MTIQYYPKIATITFIVSLHDYDDGDYCVIHSNSGSGAINWVTPHDYRQFPIFASGRTRGWGHMPWGHFPWGWGQANCKLTANVNTTGTWIFGVASYDKYGNVHSGSPDTETDADIDLTPKPPLGMTQTSYAAGVLRLTFLTS